MNSKRYSVKTKLKKPKEEMPADTKAWFECNLELFGESIWKNCVCKCGRWYETIDYLAPYHTERNWCKNCGFERE